MKVIACVKPKIYRNMEQWFDQKRQQQKKKTQLCEERVSQLTNAGAAVLMNEPLEIWVWVPGDLLVHEALLKGVS